MKYLRTIMVLLVLCVPILAEDFIVTEAEYVVISGNVSDTLGRTRLTPDSMRIVVTDSAGTELFDAWFESADAQCVLNGNVITFFDQWEDINGAADIGVYSIMATIASDGQGNVDLFSNYNYTLRGVTVGVEQTFNEVGDILDTLQLQDTWVATVASQTIIRDTTDAILDTLALQDGWVAQEASLYDPASDSVIVDGSSLAATTGAIAAATIGADAITAAKVAPSVHIEAADTIWNEVLTGGTHNVTNSAGKILRQLKEGSQIAEGTAQASDGYADGQTIVLASGTNFADDELNAAIIVLTGGTGVGQARHIEDWTGATDSITLHSGNNWATNPDNTSTYQVFPDAAKDVIHIDDSALADIWGDTTAFKVAGSRGLLITYLDSLNLYDGWIAQEAGEIGDILDTLQNQDDWVAQNSSFDTLKYLGGVWVDDGANTNTVVGTDGVPTNPVGTIAAAKTIADALGLKRIYFIEGTNETIGATMEHYEFIGLGATMDVSIALGDQDVDGSKFENVYISGIQAGTGFMLANSCILDGADSLEIHAVDCAIQGPISVRGGDSYFDNCYSTVAGVGTPNLDFDGDAAAINISMRHYSGGLQVLGMTSNHTISYESDGQLIINADCVSGNVVARGMMTITDNGTTTSLTKDAVFSRAESGEWVPTDTNASGEVLGTMPDDWTAADSAGFQGAAGALDSTAVAGAAQQALEDVGYNSADSTLDLTQINVTASGSNDAVTFTGGSVAGDAFALVGLGTVGHGLSIDLSGGGDGVNIRTTSGQAIDAAGASGTNAAVTLAGPGGAWDDGNTGILIRDTTEAGKEVAFMPDDWVAADSTGYQGAAAGLDSTAVYGAVEQLMADSQGVWVPADTLADGEQIAFMPDDWAAADSTGYQGGAAGLDSTAVYGAVEQMFADSGVTRMDSTQRWVITGLAIDGANSTEGSFSVVNDDGNAVVFDASDHPTAGGLVVLGGNLDYGIHATGGAGGIRGEANAVDGGFGIGGFGHLSGPGIVGIGGPTGHGVLGQGGSTSGAGMRLTGPGSATNSSYGLYVTGEDTAIYVVGDDTHIEPPWNDLGSGPDTIVLYFNDTSGTDTPIGGVVFAIQNSVGTPVAAYSSDMATGTRTVHLTDGSYTVIPAKDGYVFPSYALTASGNDDSVEVAGYDVVVGSAGVDSVCRVYGYISKGFDSVDARSVTVTATLPNDTYDSCASKIIVDRIRGTRSNANGYWFLDLIFSSCLNSEMYQFTFEKKGIDPFTKSITVPDSVSHQVTWGD